MGELVVHVGKKDPNFVITNADGNAASGINNINIGLKIVHPTVDDTLFSRARGTGL
jgi:phosphoketolase